MKHWALPIVLLYVLILAALTVPVAWIAFVPRINLASLPGVYLTWPYWVWLLVMGLGQAALLFVPVRLATGRPVTRGSLWPPLLAAGLMVGAMVCAIVLAIYETIYMARENNGDRGNWFCWSAIGIGVLTWIIWTVVFFRLSRDQAPGDVISRQCRLLLKGSILELLVAVPMHIVARCRDYCCAGMMTFLGLTMGISVMLFSFGPAVLFLYVARWKQLHPKPAGGPGV